MKNNKEQHIVIVGGGTSGWLSAAFLSKNLPSSIVQDIKISLIEASDIPTIGVGEATTPSLKLTLEAIGIDEFDFMRSCEATFKHGIEFNNWLNEEHSYFHPFQAPIRANNEHFAKHWCRLNANDREKYAQLAGIQSELASKNFAPKKFRSGNFNGAIPYAYHLDAGKLAEFLKDQAKASGVDHIVAKVKRTEDDQEGNIRSIHLDNDTSLHPDLVIDCTGFASLFINRDKNNRFINKNDVLFCDSAVTTRVDINGLEDIVPYTKSTAQKNGWIWDINLTKRRGVGHVYSSKYTSEENAVNTLASYLRKDQDSFEYRKLKMRIGYHERQWRGNCIAVGLSGGFLEPLESTGIYLVEMAVWSLNQLIPRYLNGCKHTEDDFNATMVRHFENITDFIKLHYCISHRRDSQFWIDNCNTESIPESLKVKLEKWKCDPPNDYDFEHGIVCFNSENYQYILYGMDFEYKLPESFNADLSCELLNTVKQKRLALKERSRILMDENTGLLKNIFEGSEQAKSFATSQKTSGSNYRVY